MPKIFIPISGTRESVTRPIVTSITQQLMEWTGINKTTPIFYPGDNERVAQTGVTITPSATPNITNYQERIAIEVDENTDQARMIAEAVYRPEHYPIFLDEALDVTIAPVYSSSEITINFKYRAKDKAGAMRWRDDIRAHTALNREYFLHSVEYSYLVPDEAVIILKEIHRLRENVAGYGENWDAYFTKYSTGKLTVLNNLSGSQGAYAIAETQARCVGWFDFEGEPEKGNREGDGDDWVISFAYKFIYSKPIGCYSGYPILIHNQLLSSKFRESEPYPSSSQSKHYHSLSGTGFAMFDATNKTTGIPSGIAIPGIDEFIPASVMPHTVRVFTALCALDLTPNADSSILMNLNELGDSSIDPAIIPFLKAESPYLAQPFNSIFSVSVYEGGYPLEWAKVTVLPDLTVKLNYTPNPRKTYRVRLGLFVNFRLVNNNRANAIQDYPSALGVVLEALNCNWDPSRVLKGIYVPTPYFEEIITQLDFLDGNIRVNNYAGTATVQLLTIHTARN